MTISVIIPTLHEEKTLPGTLARLRHPAFSEVLVVDGGSRDRTLADVALANPLTRIMNAPTGRARQMNAGAAVSKGELLLFLHADTLLPTTAAQDITRAMADTRIAGGRFDARLVPDRGLLWVVGRMMSWRSRLTGIATGDQAIFVRRKVFEDLGGFPDIPIMEDIAFSLRLKQAGQVAALHSCVMTSGRRWERHGAIRTIVLMWWLRLLFYLGVSPARLTRMYDDAR
ncbi:MAG: TIGR04283 family arsenosugar biosynthesis glycosyltransferase [Nitrospirae bacterium]|nr:TIGR04283 family arsenosugar biosynthesis glycosyltransferase [Nitrospirota bacterium]